MFEIHSSEKLTLQLPVLISDRRLVARMFYSRSSSLHPFGAEIGLHLATFAFLN
jgi:hypothetical protein